MEAGRSRRTAFLAQIIAELPLAERERLANGARIMMRIYEQSRDR
jgi:hypothetical protein